MSIPRDKAPSYSLPITSFETMSCADCFEPFLVLQTTFYAFLNGINIWCPKGHELKVKEEYRIEK